MKEGHALKGSEIITILNVIYRIITLPLIPNLEIQHQWLLFHIAVFIITSPLHLLFQRQLK